jgi:hypothetical protein
MGCSKPLLAATLVCVTIGVLLPFSPLANTLGFTRLPPGSSPRSHR